MMLKKIFKITGIVLLVLIGVAFAAPYLFKNQIIQKVKKEINKNLNANVDFKDVDISFFRQFPKVAIALDSLRITGKDVFANDTLFVAERVDAALNIMSVIKGKDMKIYSIFIASPRIHAIVNKDSLVNWDIMKPDSSNTNTASDKPFKMALQKSKQLSAIKWIIQDEQYVKADKAYFLQTKPNDMKQFFGVLKLLEITDADKLANRHIFLTRNKNRIRFIENAEEIEAIAVKYNFEIVDSDKISFLDQIKLFSSTSHLIGIHGAGLTNVMFRLNAPLTVLELLPGDYIEPHYFWLSKGMGHKYFCQLGSKSHIDTSFSINATQFENKIKQMLAL